MLSLNLNEVADGILRDVRKGVAVEWIDGGNPRAFFIGPDSIRAPRPSSMPRLLTLALAAGLRAVDRPLWLHTQKDFGETADHRTLFRAACWAIAALERHGVSLTERDLYRFRKLVGVAIENIVDGQFLGFSQEHREVIQSAIQTLVPSIGVETLDEDAVAFCWPNEVPEDVRRMLNLQQAQNEDGE